MAENNVQGAKGLGVVLAANFFGILAGFFCYVVIVVVAIYFLLDSTPSPRNIQASRQMIVTSVRPVIEAYIPADISHVDRSDFRKSNIVLTEYGLEPAIAADGTEPFVVYGARETQATICPVQLAIVLRGFGLNEARSQAAVDLPSEIGFVLSPYLDTAAKWSFIARELGHELLLDFPLEPVDAGAENRGYLQFAFRNAPPAREISLRKILVTQTGYIGIYTDQESLFTRSGVQQIGGDMQKRGLIWFEYNVPYAHASQLGVDYRAPDNAESLTEMMAEMATIKRMLKNGSSLLVSLPLQWVVFPTFGQEIESLRCSDFIDSSDQDDQRYVLIPPSFALRY